MHPDCIHGRLAHWLKSKPEHRAKLEYVLKTTKLTKEFISFTLTNCNDWIDWENPGDWAKAVDSFKNYRRKEFIKERLNWEYNDLWHSSKTDYHGSGGRFGLKGADNPYCSLWVRECTHFVTQNHGVVMAALLMEVIEPFDAARLQFDGDLIKTKRAYRQVIKDLREWINR